MFCDLKKPGALVSAVLPKENADLPKKLLFLREKQFPQVRLKDHVPYKYIFIIIYFFHLILHCFFCFLLIVVEVLS